MGRAGAREARLGALLATGVCIVLVIMDLPLAAKGAGPYKWDAQRLPTSRWSCPPTQEDSWVQTRGRQDPAVRGDLGGYGGMSQAVGLEKG